MVKFQRLLRRPLLLLATVFLSYLSFIALLLYSYQYLRTKHQLNLAWHQTASVLTANHQYPPPALHPEYAWYLFDDQGVLHWKSGTSRTVFEKVNFANLKTQGPMNTVYLDSGRRYLIMQKFVYSETKAQAVVIISKQLPEHSISDEYESALRLNLENITRQITIQNGQITLPPNQYYSQIDGLILVDRFGTIINSQGFVPYTVDLSHLETFFEPATGTLSSGKQNYLYQTAPLAVADTQYLLCLVYLRPPLTKLIIPILQISVIASLSQVMVIGLLFPKFFFSASKPVSSVRFVPDTGQLTSINHSVIIPPNTNQYQLLAALISNPKKLWYTDELADSIFGVVDNPKQYQRPIYDAARLLNDKTKSTLKIELIRIQSGCYRLNPDIQIESL